jgi:hypothetical protein
VGLHARLFIPRLPRRANQTGYGQSHLHQRSRQKQHSHNRRPRAWSPQHHHRLCAPVRSPLLLRHGKPYLTLSPRDVGSGRGRVPSTTSGRLPAKVKIYSISVYGAPTGGATNCTGCPLGSVPSPTRFVSLALSLAISLTIAILASAMAELCAHRALPERRRTVVPPYVEAVPLIRRRFTQALLAFDAELERPLVVRLHPCCMESVRSVLTSLSLSFSLPHHQGRLGRASAS